MILTPQLTLEAVLAGAVAANQPEFHVDYVLYNLQDVKTKPSPFRGALNSTTDVTLLAPPQQGFIAEVLGVSIYNADTASVTVIVKTTDGTDRIINRTTLATLETLHYDDQRGWYSTDANGAIKTGSLTYAEGSWTPTFTFATAGDLSVTYSTRVGRYIRIGDQVTVWFAIITSAFTHTTASGNAQITTLPFTPENITGFLARSSLQWSGITKANYTDICALIGPNSTTMTLGAQGSAQAAANVTASDMPTGGSVILVGTITYAT